LVSFGGCFYARDWAVALPIWGGPFSYWLAAQGAVLVFILLVALYAAIVNRMESQDLADENDGPHV
jgi:putative solute:sodium symporter small subunit